MSSVSNAFTVNSLAGKPFPFSVEIQQESNLQRVSIYPISIYDIRDIIEKFSLDFFVVFDVDHYWTKNDSQQMTLAEVAEEQEVQFQSYDKEIIFLRKEEFSKFLANYLSHYNWETFDCLVEPKSELILENYVICKDHDWKSGEFLLNKLRKARFYLYSHDDCYLTVESSNKNFINQIIQRNIKIYTTTILSQKNLKIEVASFPHILINEVLSEKNTFTIFQENSFFEENNLIIPFSNTKYHFTEQKEYTFSGNISFDYEKNEWSVERKFQ